MALPFPNEVIASIFTHLDHNSLKAAMLTCRLWHELARRAFTKMHFRVLHATFNKNHLTYMDKVAASTYYSRAVSEIQIHIDCFYADYEIRSRFPSSLFLLAKNTPLVQRVLNTNYPNLCKVVLHATADYLDYDDHSLMTLSEVVDCIFQLIAMAVQPVKYLTIINQGRNHHYLSSCTIPPCLSERFWTRWAMMTGLNIYIGNNLSGNEAAESVDFIINARGLKKLVLEGLSLPVLELLIKAAPLPNLTHLRISEIWGFCLPTQVWALIKRFRHTLTHISFSESYLKSSWAEICLLMRDQLPMLKSVAFESLAIANLSPEDYSHLIEDEYLCPIRYKIPKQARAHFKLGETACYYDRTMCLIDSVQYDGPAMSWALDLIGSSFYMPSELCPTLVSSITQVPRQLLNEVDYSEFEF